MHKALDNVERSLRLFGRDSRCPVMGITISSNVQPLSRRQPDDPGIAVWFSWDNEQRCIPVDRFLTVEANLQAVHKILEARRVELKLGGITMARATFTGFKALPAAKTWRQVFGYDAAYRPSAERLSKDYKTLAFKVHPDHGGSTALMAEINAARDAAIRELQL